MFYLNCTTLTHIITRSEYRPKISFFHLRVVKEFDTEMAQLTGTHTQEEYFSRSISVFLKKKMENTAHAIEPEDIYFGCVYSHSVAEQICSQLFNGLNEERVI